MFLQDEPIGPGDRVPRGTLRGIRRRPCEEMWLAWAATAPASSRLLVRWFAAAWTSGPWLVLA